MSPPGHHHVKRYPRIGQPGNEKKEVKVIEPMCPQSEKTMLDCIAQKRNQYECRYIIRDHNDCLFRINFIQ